MALVSPKNGALIGGIVQLVFDPPVVDINVKVNDISFHIFQNEQGCTLDLNALLPDQPISISIEAVRKDDTTFSDRVVVFKPRHDLGGMGATVVHDSEGLAKGTFFKFWLPLVSAVYVRGSFNEWRDANRLNQLGDSGYWYGFAQQAQPGDDYMFFVYGADGNFDEVSDPAARSTKKTRFNAADANDANAVIIDPAAFRWRHDEAFLDQRKDFRRHIIYQVHWGTFMRLVPDDDYSFETFVQGNTDDEKRSSVRTKLQYVRDLGFTVIQLLPVHEANGNFNAGYDPSFFFAVETAYGLPADLRILVDEAHGIGLAVIFDSVINHLTKDETHSSFSQEFIKGWYTLEDAPWSNHNQWGGENWGPDPDFDRPEILNLLTDTARVYLDEFHVDGIRFDATTTIPAHALKPMLQRLQQAYAGQGKYLVAEHLTSDPFPYIIGDVGFNGGWYKPAWEAATFRVLGVEGQGDVAGLWTIFETDYNGQPTTAVKYLLGSHDEVWSDHGGMAAVSRYGGSGNFFARSKMRLAWALNVCSLGTPMLFMGTEHMTDISWHNYFGYNGHNHHTPGDGIEWAPEEGSTAAHFQKMIRDINGLHSLLGAFHTGNQDCQLVHVDETNGIVAYKRWDNEGCVLLIVINISDHQWEHREYRLNTATPRSRWKEIFNSQDEIYGGWGNSGNAGSQFFPEADDEGKLQGINIPKWSVLLLKCEL